MNEEESSAVKELGIIHSVLTCKEYKGLLPEIIWSAFNFLKEVPNASLEDAMNFGANEWIK